MKNFEAKMSAVIFGSICLENGNKKGVLPFRGPPKKNGLKKLKPYNGKQAYNLSTYQSTLQSSGNFEGYKWIDLTNKLIGL